eukprot:6179961-Pleurochrysis_carterae.AAC.2
MCQVFTECNSAKNRYKVPSRAASIAVVTCLVTLHVCFECAAAKVLPFMEITSAHQPHRVSDWNRMHRKATLPNSFLRTDLDMKQHRFLRTQQQLETHVRRAAISKSTVHVEGIHMKR